MDTRKEPEQSKSRQRDYAEEFAAKIIAGLKDGTAPWVRPWKAGEYVPAFNPLSGTVYKGSNSVRLAAMDYADPRWMTLQQANAEGWRIKKGSKSQKIAFWKFTREENVLDESGRPQRDADGNPLTRTVRLARPFVMLKPVFHASQIDGGIPEWQTSPPTWNTHERAERLLQRSGAVIVHDQRSRAFYRPGTDEIHLPPKGQFPSEEAYYGTALHELAHWTGAPERLNRQFGQVHGSEEYAREELRAEIASWMLCMEVGLPYTPDQSLSYVDFWIKALENDPYEIVRACQDAEKIKEHVLGFEKERELEAHVETPEHMQESEAGEKRLDRLRELQEQTQSPAMSAEAEFAEQLREAGLDLKGELPVMDGRLHRVPLLDRPHARDGAYKGYLDGRPAGWFQNHVTGESGTWKYSAHRLHPAEVSRLREESARKREEEQRELRARYEKAAKRSYGIFANAAPAPADHPYLQKKGVPPLGVKVDQQGNLLVPGRDTEGFQHTLQIIPAENGKDKRFIAGSRKQGTFHLIDPNRTFGQGPILIAEGYATAASLHLVTGMPVVSAFDAGNLIHVAKALHEKFPDQPVALMADNDVTNARNPGINKAKLAAEAVGGAVYAPSFTPQELRQGMSDWNDLHMAHGLDALRKQIDFDRPFYRAPVKEQEKTHTVETGRAKKQAEVFDMAM